MGLDTKRPPLPAPTEPSTLDSSDDAFLRTDVSTNVSTRTDRTSYSVPEDGTPITINTTKPQGTLHKKFPSQTSLLIEYFEAGKEDGKTRSRPSVRVKVTPSSRKNKNVAASDHVKITQTSRQPHKPSYTRRISLGTKPRDEIIDTRTTELYSEESEVSSLPPVEIEVLQNTSDVSSNGAGRFHIMASDVSSMPPDSMLDGSTPAIKPPGRRRSRSLERETVAEAMAAEERATLKAPRHQRSRSLSKDRITQRVMEKLQQQQALDDAALKSKKITTKEELASPRKERRRRSKDVEEVSGTESSLLSSNADRRSGAYSARSAVSGTSSIQNPKLLATVEDAIKRLILPELNALKEEKQSSRHRDKFERMSREDMRGSTAYDVDSTTSSRDPSRRRPSKSSSAPKLSGSKPKVVLNRHGDDPGVVLSSDSIRKERRSSRGSTSERSYAESTSREKSEKTHRRKSKDKSSSTSVRDQALAGLAGAGLTAAALRSHTSHEEREEERKHRKRHSSRSSRSRSASIAESAEEVYKKEHVPPLPFNHSELIGSEMTRDSILSAETDTRKRPESRDSRSSINGSASITGVDRSLGIETPLQEVPRGILSPAPRTPTRTPNALQQTLGTSHSNRSTGEVRTMTPKSDRSYFSRREGNSASLEAAAAAKARAIERSDPNASQFEIDEDTPNRGVSPIQSEASYREDVNASGSPRHMRSYHSGASVSSLGQDPQRPQSTLSIGSLVSTASTKAARTRKRPQGITLESKRSVLGENETPKDAEDFFEKNHEKNEMYRRELEESSQASPGMNYNRMTQYTDDSAEGQYLDYQDKANFEDVRKVGVTPEYVHTPLAVESAVASLHDPSTISVRSSAVSSPLKKSRLSQVSPSPSAGPILHQDEVPSGQRWAAIRGEAEALHHQAHVENSPRQSIAQSVDEQPQMHHSAFPTNDHMMPEIGYGVHDDNDSDITTNPSIIQGPLDGGDGHYDQTDDILSRQEERERTPTSFSKGGALGAGAGAAAIAAAAAHHLHSNQSPVSYDERRQASVEDEYDQEYRGETQYEQSGYAHSNRTPVSGATGWKDEGYQSANAREAYTPQGRNHSKLFDDDGLGDEYDDTGLGGPDLFAHSSKHNRHQSGNSHGMASPLYDSATGKGIDRIQSKDIVALMDHLTVRDAQRNARDTEILVTLVRSAAEMRNQLDDLKQFIKVQDSMIVGTTDKRVGMAEQRILGGPRPQPVSSPRANRSSSEEMEADTKKKSVFKRALKGLSMKGGGDMKHIEDMLMQLLDEVEGLKHVNQLSLDQQARTNSMTSYENLRASGASGDAGYEPEGRANTASSPDQSGYLSNPSSARRIQDLHSGYDVPATNRVSTVQEVSDEEYDERDERDQQYENTERMTTPTQEVYHERKMSQETPPQASRGMRDSQSQENTPKRKHKSNSSSIFGIPKISRWSKTTASTNPETLPRNSGSSEKRPYSSHSRSGSRQSLEYYDDEPYDMRDDDRLSSKQSFAREERASIRSARSPSPLIPEDDLQYEMEDPKYQAHRNSLNLQHPQPRAGPTGRHQNHLETQAQIYEPLSSPDYDQWGSMPALARNRMSAGSAPQGPMSPISSDGGYSQHSASEQQAPPRPPKIADDGPLIPPQQPLAGYGQTRQMYSSTNEFGSQGALTPLAPIAEVRYSLETDRGHRIHATPTPSPRPSSQHLRANATMNSPQRKITGPRPMGSRSPSGNAGLQHSDTVIRRKPIADDQESLQSYRSSLDSEIF